MEGMVLCGAELEKRLILAVQQGCRTSVEECIDKGARNWNAALVSAAEYCQLHLVDMFLDMGVKISRVQAVGLNDKVPIIVGYMLKRNAVIFLS